MCSIEWIEIILSFNLYSFENHALTLKWDYFFCIILKILNRYLSKFKEIHISDFLPNNITDLECLIFISFHHVFHVIVIRCL